MGTCEAVRYRTNGQPKIISTQPYNYKKGKNINTLKKKKQRMTQVTFLKYTTTAHFKTINIKMQNLSINQQNNTKNIQNHIEKDIEKNRKSVKHTNLQNSRT